MSWGWVGGGGSQLSSVTQRVHATDLALERQQYIKLPKLVRKPLVGHVQGRPSR